MEGLNLYICCRSYREQIALENVRLFDAIGPKYIIRRVNSHNSFISQVLSNVWMRLVERNLDDGLQ
jgi:hypothetical protein